MPLFLPLWSWQELAALLLNIAGLALAFFLLLRLTTRLKFLDYIPQAVVFPLPLITISNLIRTSYSESELNYWVVGTIGVLLFLSAGVLFIWRRRLGPVVEFVALGLALLLPINVIRAGIESRKNQPMAQLAPRLAGASGTRVIWIIFDEMDYTLAFPQRASDVSLPEFDRLRSESLFATSAHQAGRNTADAIPSLLTGRKVTRVRPVGDRTLLVDFSTGSEFVDLAQVPNSFSDARSAQINVGVVGWLFPYCRMFPSDITECEWASLYSSVSDNPDLWNNLLSQFFALTPLESRMRQIYRMPRLLAKARQIATDPRLGLVFVHFSLPHGPPIFDRNTGKIKPFYLHKDWYFDNLVLADHLLGELRHAIEHAGVWDSSALIVSFDHSLRVAMMPHPNPTPLVPFMVKCPGQHVGSTYNVPMNALITRDLIRAFEMGEVSAEILPGWLRTHSQ